MNKVYTTRELVELARQRGRSVTQSYVGRLCRQGRIEGAYKIGRDWVLPEWAAQRWLVAWTASERT